MSRTATEHELRTVKLALLLLLGVKRRTQRDIEQALVCTRGWPLGTLYRAIVQLQDAELITESNPRSTEQLLADLDAIAEGAVFTKKNYFSLTVRGAYVVRRIRTLTDPVTQRRGHGKR
jgi:DNA-binding PadR family transcriptional regulator